MTSVYPIKSLLSELLDIGGNNYHYILKYGISHVECQKLHEKMHTIEQIKALVMIRFICVKTQFTSNLKHLLTILKKFHPVLNWPQNKMYWVCSYYKSNIFFELKLTQFLICQQSNWVKGTKIKWDEIFSVYRSQCSCRSVSLHWPVIKSWDGDWSPSHLASNLQL